MNVYNLYHLTIMIINLLGLDMFAEKLYNNNRYYITRNLDLENMIYLFIESTYF